MNPEQKGNCKEFSSLLVRKIAGEILAHEKRALESHLAHCPSCAIEERELIATFQKLDSLPDPEIPAELYENTRQTILGGLRQEKSRAAWFTRIPITGPWRALFSPTAGLAMTAISYGLIHRLINPSVHHHYLLVPLFSLWWMLFTVGFWSILRIRDKKAVLSPLDLVSASSISITFLTLLIAFVAFELDSLRWVAMSAAYEMARASHYLFGIGNTFVTAWWVHCCLASFIGAFIFGISRSPRSSENLFVGSFVVMILLSPAIYLQGAAHNHGLGVIAFAAAGTYIGSIVGMSLGLFIRRKLAFQVT
jgi:putative zinc finger protein